MQDKGYTLNAEQMDRGVVETMLNSGHRPDDVVKALEHHSVYAKVERTIKHSRRSGRCPPDAGAGGRSSTALGGRGTLLLGSACEPMGPWGPGPQ